MQDVLERVFFERLSAVCKENIIVALFYWLKSLEADGPDRFNVMPMRPLNLELIHGFSMDRAHILNAVLQHDNLTADELADILDTDLIQTRLELEIMANQNILEFNRDNRRYRFNTVAFDAVARMLSGRNIYY